MKSSLFLADKEINIYFLQDPYSKPEKSMSGLGNPKHEDSMDEGDLSSPLQQREVEIRSTR